MNQKINSMKKLIRYTLLSLLFIVLILTFFVIRTMYNAGSFKTISPHFDGTEQIVETLPGTEDITIDQETGIAYISTDDRRSTLKGEKGKKGAIMCLDLNNEKNEVIEMTSDLDKDFHPHGISLFKTKEGKKLLFVVSHLVGIAVEKHFIEIFEIQGKKLKHLESIEDPLMTSPNDVVAVGERSFYVSNDHYYIEKGLMRSLEEYMNLPYSFVNYYDGKSFKKVIDGVKYANGINVSNDGKTLFLACITGLEVRTYEINKETGELNAKDIIYTGTGIDNIEVDAEDNLWIGCHAQLLAFVAYAADKNKKSPSQVLKIDIKNGNKVEEIYMNDGTSLSGSSAAAVYKNQLLIGSVLDAKILRCTLK